jgi:hypothetical protein
MPAIVELYMFVDDVRGFRRGVCGAYYDDFLRVRILLKFGSGL